MADDSAGGSAAQGASAPRSVTRGAEIRLGFLGIDSLYVVLEYPSADVFEFWSAYAPDRQDKRLYVGLPVDDFLIRKGGNGYALSVWQGDARLFITDQVDDRLREKGSSQPGMGVMLQLGPKWLRQYGDILSPGALAENVLAQMRLFQVKEPEQYAARLNRVDIALDVLGLLVADFSIDDWRKQWVGRAQRKTFFDAPITGELQTVVIGSSNGSVRFKVYDKIAESLKSGSLGFWRSVWGLADDDGSPVARFEWTLKVHEAHFTDLRYLPDLTFEGFLDLLNYASLKWGGLRVPHASDSNRSRWDYAPLWIELRRLIDDWSFNYKKIAKRQYDYRPDLTPAYLKSAGGWLGGLMARVGLHEELDSPAALITALDVLAADGISVSDKAKEKYAVLSRLVGGGENRDG